MRTPHSKVTILDFNSDSCISKHVQSQFIELCKASRFLKLRWSLKREVVDNHKNAFYFEGGRNAMPKIKISFDCNESANSKNNDDGCATANIFILCFDISKIDDDSYYQQLLTIVCDIKERDRENIVLYAVVDAKSQPVEITTFSEYVQYITQQHKLLHENNTIKSHNKNQIFNFFPYSENNAFYSKRGSVFSLYKGVFYFTKTYGYFDCLLYIINHTYNYKNYEISPSNNRQYRYITTKINYQSINTKTMKTLRFAVVGEPNVGKTHFIYSVLKSLERLGEYEENNPRTKWDEFLESLRKLPVFKSQYFGLEYADIQDLVKPFVTCQGYNDKDSKNNKRAEQTSDNLSRRAHHYRGIITAKNGKKKCLEFIDVPGEACWPGKLEMYSLVKKLLGDYTKQNSPFLKEIWTNGEREVYKLVLKVDKTHTENGEQQETNLSNPMQASTIENLFRFVSRSVQSGKNIIKEFDLYDIDSLIEALKTKLNERLEKRCSENRVEYSKTFWNSFYAYVFLEKCNDIVYCDILNNMQNNDALIGAVGKLPNKNLYFALTQLDLLLNAENFRKHVVDKECKPQDVYWEVQKQIYQWINLEKDSPISTPLLNTKAMKGSAERVRRLVGHIRGQDNRVEIIPHCYFTAFPIDSHGDIYTAPTDSLVTFTKNGKNFDVTGMLNLGTINFVIDFLNANDIPDYHEKTEYEDALYGTRN